MRTALLALVATSLAVAAVCVGVIVFVEVRERWWNRDRRRHIRQASAAGFVPSWKIAPLSEDERLMLQAARCNAFAVTLDEIHALPVIEPWKRWLPS